MLQSAIIALLLTAPTAESAEALKPGDTAPTLSLPGTQDASIDLASFRGQVVLLNFWASWCGPCITEMPLLQDLHTRGSTQGLTVLAVNLDRKRRPAQGVIDHLDLSLPVAFDADGAFVDMYGPAALPMSFLITPEGAIHTTYAGALDDADIAAIEETAKGLLEDGGS